ncbi:MAG: SRPBCC domain-containing protein [Leptospiraceae bacterium]|nr:SRPBCC domain-containing protein [Leptospiraceae bacterium]
MNYIRLYFIESNKLKKNLLKLIKGILLTSIFLSCKSIHTELFIKANPEKVWEVITNAEGYSTWNPYHVEVKGKIKPGEKIQVKIHKPNGNKITLNPKIMSFEKNRLLSWGGGVMGIFTGEHVFEIIPTADGVLFIQREKFQGIAVPFAELDTIEEGYNLMNSALKKKLENL